MTKFYKPYAPHEIDELPEEIKGRLKATLAELPDADKIDTLTKENDELEHQVDALQDEVNALEDEVNALEDEISGLEND